MPLFDAEAETVLGEAFQRADAFLFGRRTDMAAHSRRTSRMAHDMRPAALSGGASEHGGRAVEATDTHSTYP